MNPTRPLPSFAGREPGAAPWVAWGAVAIAATAAAAYAGTFHAPFVFDDLSSIPGNPTLRSLAAAWHPPNGNGSVTVAGRPILNLSLAFNHAVSGVDVWSYHAVNLAIHFLAGLTLFGLVRRTLQLPALPDRLRRDAAPVALAVALLWTAHPLQTEAVTYVVQRAESLMGLFFLLTLYGFVRSVESPHPRAWAALAVGACLLGAGTKEIAALAPPLVLLHDRTFVSGTFRAAWRRHRGTHLALFASWILLGWLVAGTGGDRGGSFRLGDPAVWTAHALTQFEAVTRYLVLAVWPHRQVFDYGEIAAPTAGAAVLWALPVLALIALTLLALRRWPAAGFLGAWFFAILAPTSLLPATLQIIVEHRMYLPLAAVAILAVTGLHRVAGRRSLLLFFALAPALVGITRERNRDYRSALALWTDTLAKRPGNVRACDSLGSCWLDLGNFAEAERDFRKAVQLQPDYALAHYNLGVVLQRTGRPAEAVAEFLATLRLDPSSVNAEVDAGIALLRLGRAEEAEAHFERADRLQPDSGDLVYDLGLGLNALGRTSEAIAAFERAVALEPEFAPARAALGAALLRVGRAAEAVKTLREAVRLEPADVEARVALADAEVTAADPAAERDYREALQLQPSAAAAHLGLGYLLARTGRLPEAVAELGQGVRLDPGNPLARLYLGNALLGSGRVDEAIAAYQEVLRLRPDEPGALQNLRQAQAIKRSGPRRP